MTAKVHSHVMLAGLAMLVPVPILDDWLYRKALRNALSEEAAVMGAPLDEATLDVLTADRTSYLVGCLKAVVVWPIKKLFRTFFFFLTMKDSIDAWAQAAETLAMVRIARAEGWLPARVGAVRDAIEVSFGRHRWSPVTRFVMRYERPDTGEPPAEDQFGRLLQGLRKQAGAGAMETMFVERARAEIEVLETGVSS